MNNLHELMEASHNKHAQDMNAGIYCILIMRKKFSTVFTCYGHKNFKCLEQSVFLLKILSLPLFHSYS